jgi:hypothetical protein
MSFDTKAALHISRLAHPSSLKNERMKAACAAQSYNLHVLLLAELARVRVTTTCSACASQQHHGAPQQQAGCCGAQLHLGGACELTAQLQAERTILRHAINSVTVTEFQQWHVLPDTMPITWSSAGTSATATCSAHWPAHSQEVAHWQLILGGKHHNIAFIRHLPLNYPLWPLQSEAGKPCRHTFMYRSAYCAVSVRIHLASLPHLLPSIQVKKEHTIKPLFESMT